MGHLKANGLWPYGLLPWWVTGHLVNVTHGSCVSWVSFIDPFPALTKTHVVVFHPDYMQLSTR